MVGATVVLSPQGWQYNCHPNARGQGNGGHTGSGCRTLLHHHVKRLGQHVALRSLAQAEDLKPHRPLAQRGGIQVDLALCAAILPSSRVPCKTRAPTEPALALTRSG